MRDVVGVAAHAVANDLGQNRGAAAFRELQIFQDQDAGAFANDEAVAVFIPRTAGLLGSSLRVERARMAANPPTPMGVMAASVPPAIMTSASPR